MEMVSCTIFFWFNRFLVRINQMASWTRHVSNSRFQHGCFTSIAKVQWKFLKTQNLVPPNFLHGVRSCWQFAEMSVLLYRCVFTKIPLKSRKYGVCTKVAKRINWLNCTQCKVKTSKVGPKPVISRVSTTFLGPCQNDETMLVNFNNCILITRWINTVTSFFWKNHWKENDPKLSERYLFNNSLYSYP